MRPQNQIEWFDSSEMHEHSKKWFSQLSFVKDEQTFLCNLIQNFALKPLEENEFKRLNDFKISIAESQKVLISIFKQVQKHMNLLEILLDDVNQPEMEIAYRKTHDKLYMKVNRYLISFRTIKHRGFSNLTYLLKKSKKFALCNPEYKLRA